MASAEREYMNMIKAGCTPQIARSVLPICLKTEIHMACDFTEWRHVIRLRTSKAAHPDIRYLIEGVHMVLKQYAPTVFGDL
jgi:thymidylate synthase (FAD)